MRQNRPLTKTVLFHRLTIVTINADDTVSKQTRDCRLLSEYDTVKKTLKPNQLIEADELYEQTFQLDYRTFDLYAKPVSDPKPHIKRGSRVLN